MKKLLLLFFLTPMLLIAQDSTYIQYSSEATETFKPIKLVDEFETAFGMNEKVNFRLKAGLKSFDNLVLTTSRTWEISGELAVFKHSSIKANVYQSSTSNALRFSNYLMFDIEFRHYLNKKDKLNTLSGTYLSIASTINATSPLSLDQDFLIGSFQSLGQNRYRDERKLWKLDLGQQYGRFMDIGLRIGLKNVALNSLDQNGYLVTGYKDKFLPYLSSYSSLSFGLDFPRNKGNTDFCPFLNCNQKLNHLFKIDLSGMFYLDQFTQNIQNELSFEQKLGKLPLSLSVGTIFGLDRYQAFRNIGIEDISTEFGTREILTFENDLLHPIQFTMQAYGELRFYAFQKSMIAKGKIAPGLQGSYIGANYNWLLFFNRFYTEKFFNLVGSKRNNRIFSPVIGYQRKISKRYFIDLSLRIGDLKTNNISVGNFPINPQFKFGFAF